MQIAPFSQTKNDGTYESAFGVYQPQAGTHVLIVCEKPGDPSFCEAFTRMLGNECHWSPPQEPGEMEDQFCRNLEQTFEKLDQIGRPENFHLIVAVHLNGFWWSAAMGSQRAVVDHYDRIGPLTAEETRTTSQGDLVSVTGPFQLQAKDTLILANRNLLDHLDRQAAHDLLRSDKPFSQLGAALVKAAFVAEDDDIVLISARPKGNKRLQKGQTVVRGTAKKKAEKAGIGVVTSTSAKQNAAERESSFRGLALLWFFGLIATAIHFFWLLEPRLQETPSEPPAPPQAVQQAQDFEDPVFYDQVGPCKENTGLLDRQSRTDFIQGLQEQLVMNDADRVAADSSETEFRAEYEGKIRDEGRWASYLQSLVDDLVRAFPEQALSFKVYWVDDPLENAFALPNGSIYVFRGLTESLENEAQAAFVLSHEIGHVVLHHGLPRLRMKVTQVEMIDKALATLGTLPFSVPQEIEADYFAVTAMSKSGYSPYQAVRLMEAWLQEETETSAGSADEKTAENRSTETNIIGQVLDMAGDTLAELSQTHPDYQERVCNVKTYLNTYYKDRKREDNYVGTLNFMLSMPKSKRMY